MVSTKNTTFLHLNEMFNQMKKLESEENWSAVTAIKVNIQDWFMGSASRTLDLQVAYLTEPDTFEKIWKAALEGDVHKFDEFLMSLFPDKRELFVANSDVKRLMEERDKLFNLVAEQRGTINQFETDFTKMVKEIQEKNEEIYSLNAALGVADNEINEATNEINRQSEEILRLKAKMFDLIEGKK